MTFQPELPNHTSQVAPARLTVATLDPTGWGGPRWLIQIMISAPVFWPSTRGVGSSHRSYDAFHAPLDGTVTRALEASEPRSDTRAGSPLAVEQLL